MKLKIKLFFLILGSMTLWYCSDTKSGSRTERKASKQSVVEDINQEDAAESPVASSIPKKTGPVSPVASASGHLPGESANLPANPTMGEGQTPEPDPATPPTAEPPQNGLLALHQPAPATCNQCHESKRPSLTHYKDHDCASCHKFPSFKGASFSHDPKPATCTGCHTPPATGLRAYPNQGPPANFNAADPNALGGRHYVGKDCKECHQTPKEGAAKFVFTHSAPNPQVCLPCHFNNGSGEHQNSQTFMLSGFGNCINCHRNFDVKVRRNFGRN